MPKKHDKNQHAKNSKNTDQETPGSTINSRDSEKNNTSDNEKSDATMLQKFTQRKNGGQNAKTSETRARFLHAFEKTFGNISASCEYAGIDRKTYYRWMKSDSRINRKFQSRIALIKPVDRLVDFAEAKLMERINAGDTGAIIYVLKTKGRDRGYGENKSDLEFRLVLRAVRRIEKIINFQVAKDANFRPESHLKRLFEIAAEDFGVKAEDIEKEYFKRQPEAIERLQ